MNKPLRKELRWKDIRRLLTLMLLSFSFAAFAQPNCDNQIVINGSDYVCENEEITYGFVDIGLINPGSILWTLNPPSSGTVVGASNETTFTVRWDEGDGLFNVILTLDDYQPGCSDSYDDTLLVEVVSDFGIQLACNDTVQVSLGTDCQAQVFPDMVLEGGRPMNSDYNVYVMELNGDTIPGAILDGSHAGKILQVSVEHDCSGNSCWGWLRVEDKLPPILECTDVMIGCEDGTDPVLNGVPGFPFATEGIILLNAGINAYDVIGLDSCDTVRLTYVDIEEVQSCIGITDSTTLYSVAQNDNILRTLDTATGATITMINLVVAGDVIDGMMGLATDPSTNQIFGLLKLASYMPSTRFLATVDPASGLATVIKELNRSYVELSFNALGDKLYGVTGDGSVDPETLYQIDKFTGDETFQCALGNGDNGEAIAFNTFNNEMFHASGFDDVFESIVLNTCSITDIDVSTTPLHGDGDFAKALSFDATRGDFMLAESGGNLYRITSDGLVTTLGGADHEVQGLAFVRITPFINKITRTWIATDASGNTGTCSEMILIRPASLLEVVCPGNFDGIDNPILECNGGWLTDKNGNPSPESTGYPTGVNCFNLDYDYIDYKLRVCENSYKIIREWLIADWCSGQQIYCNQIIKVLDEYGPLCSDPTTTGADTFSINPFTCLGDITTVNAKDFIIPHGDCADIDDIIIEAFVKRGAPDCIPPPGAVGVKDGIIPNGDGTFQVKDLPPGCSWMIFRFTDPCGNSSECTYEVFIKEDQKPVAICDQHTVVTLSNIGSAKVYAQTFDDGSYDNCEVDSFAVRRMIRGNCPSGINDDTLFRNHVEFCCEDAGDTIMVVFRVYDKSGNFNECMVEIRVFDKNPPELICPPNIRVSCEYSFTDINVFGQVRYEQAERQYIIIDDINNPSPPLNNNWGLDGYYHDDCRADTTYRVQDNRNDCGVGQIRRTWTVRDGNTSRSCTQVITFTDYVHFDGTGIIYPNDTILMGCPTDVHPDQTGWPILPNTGKCANLLVTWKDDVYNVVPDACYKIIRSWIVVDWCNNNKNTNRWVRTQVIKITNTEDPFFTSSCNNKTFRTIVDANCKGIAELTVEVDDDCSPVEALVLEYRIDLYKNGSIDFRQSGDYELSATNSYPEGTHEICWTVEDKCGNRETCCYDFTMSDDKDPTPYCKSGIITVVMPSSGTIEIWASDFDDNSYDNCTAKGDLRYSFSSDINDKRRTYNCDSLKPSGIEKTFDLTVYVWDRSGNNDYCRTRVTIQDGIANHCPDNINGNMVTVSGNIITEDDETVEEVMVTIDGGTAGLPRYNMTQSDGEFAFPSIPADFNYTIGASRNDDHLNGITTLDLVMIQRHLLGISSFNSPYKHIAADVNNSNSVSAADISELRKLILGRYAELPKNTSWRFVLKSFQFSDPTSPWPFEEIMELDDVANHTTSNDFIAIKMGDINGDAKPNGLIGNIVRSGAKIELTTSENNFTHGEEVKVVLKGEVSNIFGLQVAFQFDSDVLMLTDIVHINGLTTDSNLGLGLLQDGIIQMSWNAQDGRSRDMKNGLIALTFEAIGNGKVSDVFGLNTKSIVPEAYIEDMEIVDIELNFIGNDGKVIASSDDFELFQNQPNPFDNSTRIAFALPRMEDASIHIFDVTGKTVHFIQGVFSKGINEVTVDKSQLSTSGVLYYRLETKDNMATRKMIMIE